MMNGQFRKLFLKILLFFLHFFKKLLIPGLILILLVSIFLRLLLNFYFMMDRHVLKVSLKISFHISLCPFQVCKFSGKFTLLLTDSVLNSFYISLSSLQLTSNLLFLSILFNLNLSFELIEIFTELVSLNFGNYDIFRMENGR